MTRVKKGLTNHQKHKKYLQLGKGVYGRGNRCYRICRRIYEKGMQYQNAARQINKRRYRSLFITIISAACKLYNTSYSKFMYKFSLSPLSKIIDRKSLSIIAQNNPQEIKTIISNVINTNE